MTTDDDGRPAAPVSPAAVRSRRSSARGVSREAPGTRRERRSRACVGARGRKKFFVSASSPRARSSAVGVARRGVEKGWCEGQSHLARGAGESCAREREISEEVFATCER